MYYPVGVVVSADGTLWVADRDNHRVLRFDNAAAKANGADADGVLGQADFVSNDPNRGGAAGANTFNQPHSLVLDPDGRLFVSDRLNHRVLIFATAATKPNGAAADGVLGQTDLNTGTSNTSGRSAASLSHPFWMAFDPVLPALWVADADNHRALAYGFGVTVSRVGSGSGEIYRTPNQRLYEQDSVVSLSPDPDYDTYFTAWGGACTGDNDCTLTMDDYKLATKTFLGPVYVCGSYLDPDSMPRRCEHDSIAAALAVASAGDIIVVSGVVTETVVVNKSVTIQGMHPGDILPAAIRPTEGTYPVYTPGAQPEEIAAGTHMAIVQAAPGPGTGAGSVFTIPAGVEVTLQFLNIRHGDAAQGAGINNAGVLTLEGVTVYNNQGDEGGALYNRGTMTVTNSTLTDNEVTGAGVNVYNTAAGTALVQYSTLALASGQTETKI